MASPANYEAFDDFSQPAERGSGFKLRVWKLVSASLLLGCLALLAVLLSMRQNSSDCSSTTKNSVDIKCDIAIVGAGVGVIRQCHY